MELPKWAVIKHHLKNQSYIQSSSGDWNCPDVPATAEGLRRPASWGRSPRPEKPMPSDSEEALWNFHRSQSSRGMKSKEFPTQVPQWLAPRFSGLVPERVCFPRNRQCMDEVASVKMDTESLSQGLTFFFF